jgi:hypothetical protein
LAVLLGRGPVPWIHTHETLAHHGHNEELLAWHVEHFHSPGDDDDHAWHVHWTLPWYIVNCPCQHDETAAQERMSALEMPFDVAPTASVSDAHLNAHGGSPRPPLWTAESSNPPPPDPRCFVGLRFLETYSPGVTLRALYCVARC